jgi:hypothetical protein
LSADIVGSSTSDGVAPPFFVHEDVGAEFDGLVDRAAVRPTSPPTLRRPPNGEVSDLLGPARLEFPRGVEPI